MVDLAKRAKHAKHAKESWTFTTLRTLRAWRDPEVVENNSGAVRFYQEMFFEPAIC
ncbi:MAG: hypothetical protein WD750_01805 [Gammaproteobacteria bacterium]